MIERLLDDVHQGTRIMTGAPGLCATASLLIALVIGGNTTIYSMVNGLVHSPSPGVEATDIVSFGLAGMPGAPFFSRADYTEYAAQTRTLRSLAAFGFGRTAVATPNGSFLLNTIPVTANYFETISVRPIRGRTFMAADDREGAPLVAVIGHGVWVDHFQSRPDVIGLQLGIDGYPATIVGVTPPRFAGVILSESGDVWVPMRSAGTILPMREIAMIGRRASGISLEQVQAEFGTLQARVQASVPESPGIRRAPVFVTPYAATAAGVIPAFQFEIMAIFSIVTVLTLGVVCANVANLMLARAVIRQRETAVRQALGASRLRLVRLLVAEGLSVSCIAAVLAFVFAWWAAQLIPRLLPAGPGTETMPVDFAPDWRVALYALALALIGTLMFSLAPALRAWRQDPLPHLKDGSHTTVSGRSRLSNALVVLQLGFSVLLLTAAGLGYRAATLMNLDPGFDAGRVLLVGVGTTAAARSREDNVVLLDRLRERLRRVPGVEAVSYKRTAPDVSWSREDVRAGASSEAVAAAVDIIGPDYLASLGLQPLEGRGLRAEDRNRRGTVAVINKNLADALWPRRSAVGQTLLLGRGLDQRTVEIVGVAPNAHYSQFNANRPGVKPLHVLVADQAGLTAEHRDDPGAPGTSVFYLRFRGAFETVAASIPAALAEVDSRVALASRGTVESQLDNAAEGPRTVSMLLLLFAFVSIVIAALGQYAVVAFNMRRRTRDFGVRIALGASAAQVIGSVLREGVSLTAAGLAGGFAISVAVATLLRGALFGVTPTDPPTYLAVFSILACVSLFACYLPARRASRIDPVQALRQE